MQIRQSFPQLHVDEEFKEICWQIHQEQKTYEQWCEIESDDMFQSPHYCGGFDSTEQEFCFSYIDDVGKEWWFQCTSDDIEKIVLGTLEYLDMHEAEE